MAQLHLSSELMKGSEFSWTTDTYYWQEDAACQEMPTSMWEVALEGDEIAEGLSALEIRQLNWDNLSSAKKICDSCPVRQECEDLITDTYSNQYLMFGGVWPTRAPRSSPEDPVSFGANTEVARKTLAERRADDLNAAQTRVCENGHRGHWTSGSRKVWCVDCENEGIEPGSQPEYPWCGRGHVDWRSGIRRGKPYRNCGTCNRLRKYARAHGGTLDS